MADRRGLSRLVAGPAGQAEAVKAAAGVLQFVLVARALGVADYGRWAVVSLLAALLLPVVTRGASSTFLRAAALAGPGHRLEARVVRVSLVGGLLAAALAALLTPWVLPFVAPATVAAVVLAEVGLLHLLGLRALLAQGEQRFDLYRRRSVQAAVVRVAAAAVFAVGFPGTGLAGWSGVLLAISALAALPVVLAGLRRPAEGAPVPSDDAWLFVLSALSGRVVDDADKYVLSRVAPLAEAGLYAAAYRLAAYVLVPVRAVLAQSYPRMLRLGAEGSDDVWAAACAAARRSVGVGLAAALPMTAAAAALPLLAGPEYAGTALLVLALAPALGLRGAHYAFADVLTVLGRQRVRAAAQAAAAVLPLAAYVLLVPGLGAWGAVAGTALGEALTVTVMALVGRRVLAHRPAAVPPVAVAA